MKVLLDECLPLDFRHHLPGHEVHTAEWAGLKGLKNGQLLRDVESAGYDVLERVELIAKGCQPARRRMGRRPRRPRTFCARDGQGNAGQGRV